MGDPGNAADPATGYGSVGYAYQMGKYDVTVGQYVEFLNAVAKTDTYGLYNSNMASSYPVGLPTISITRSGSSGDYSYSVAGSYSDGANCPIFETAWGDAARFCNWLQNGQPTFPSGTPGEVTGSTETGAYTLDGDTTATWKPATPRQLRHSIGERMVQGGLLQPERGHVLALPDAERHRTGRRAARHRK